MRRGLAGAAVIAACVTFAPAASAATSIVEVGWWSDSPFSSAPEGGLVVGDAPSGTTGVSAIRLDLGRGVTSAVLALEESGGFGADVAAIAVCRGAESWSAVANGNLDDAPEPQCANRPPEMERDAGRWTVDLADVLSGATGRVTVMLVPGSSPDPTGTLGFGWEVQFDPPTFTATEVAAPPTTTVTTAPARPPATTPPAAPVSAGGGSSRPSATTFVPPTTTTTTEPNVVAVGADTSPTRPALAPGRGGDEGRPWGRFGIFTLWSAVIGTLAGGGRWLVTEGPLERFWSRLPS